MPFVSGVSLRDTGKKNPVTNRLSPFFESAANKLDSLLEPGRVLGAILELYQLFYSS
jgi:hypothetical protein